MSFLVVVVTLFSVQLFEHCASDEVAENSIVLTGHSQRFYHGVIDTWFQPENPKLTLQPEKSTGIAKTRGVTFHRGRKLLIFSDADRNTIFGWNISAVANPNGSSTGFYLHIGTSSGVGQVEVDWINGNIYWTDSVYGWLALQSVPKTLSHFNSHNPNFKIIVDKYLDRPAGLAVDPYSGYIFWTDVGKQPKIERSLLRGKERRLIVWQGLLKPTALCVDTPSSGLYWTDFERATVEFSDVDGGNRRIIVSQTGKHFYWIDIFMDRLVVNDPEDRSLYQYSTTGTMKAPALTTADIKMYEFRIMSRDKQLDGDMVNANNCDNYGCSHMCFQSVSGSAECDCEDGYFLEADQKTCQVDIKILERHILYTNGTRICAVSINTINSFNLNPNIAIDCSVVQHNTSITHFAVDTHNKGIFYTDGQVLYKQTAFEEDKQIIYQTSNTIRDLDYNWKTTEVLWTVPEDGTVFKYNVLSATEPSPVTDKQNSPSSIAVDPHNDHIFWFSHDEASGVKLFRLDSTGKVEVISTGTVQLQDPTDLEYDRNRDRLVWSDTSRVFSIQVDGTDQQEFSLPTGKLYQSVIVFKDYTIITYDTTFIPVQHETSHYTTFVLPHMVDLIRDVHVFAESLQPTNLEPCEVNNGGCEHICLPNSERTCACKVGYNLLKDGKTCTTDVTTTKYYLLTDTLNHMVYRVDRDTDVIHAVVLPKDDWPVFATVDSARERLFWVDANTNKVKRSDLDGSNVEVLPSSNVLENTTVSVDATSGQVYITADHSILVVRDSDILTLIRDLPETPTKIKVHPAEGTMYWIETGQSIRIAQANMDSRDILSVATLIDSDIQNPRDIAIDYEGENIYWCDSDLGKIEKVHRISHRRNKLLGVSGISPIGIDVYGDHLYIITAGKYDRSISRTSKTDGSGFEVVFASPLLGTLSTIQVPSDTQNIVHEECKNENGGCSRFCLPRLSNRICACPEGVDLRDDGMTCNIDPVCEASIDNLEFGTCYYYKGRTCYFRCKEGYELALDTNVAKCQSKEKWNATESACRKKEDDSTFPIALVAGAGGGGVVFLVVVIVVVCLCWRKKTARPRVNKSRLPSVMEVNNLTFPAQSQRNLSESERYISSPKPVEPEIFEPEPEPENVYVLPDDVERPDETKTPNNPYIKLLPPVSADTRDGYITAAGVSERELSAEDGNGYLRSSDANRMKGSNEMKLLKNGTSYPTRPKSELAPPRANQRGSYEMSSAGSWYHGHTKDGYRNSTMSVHDETRYVRNSDANRKWHN